MAEVQKPFLIVADDVVNAYIVRTLIDVGNNKAYVEAEENYLRIPLMIRRYQNNHAGEFDYIAVFNANSDDDLEREEKIAMVKNLCRSKKSPENIGVFCFRDNIQTELHLPRPDNSSLLDLAIALKKNAAELKQSPTIVEIQKFVDTVTKKHQE